MLPHRAVYDPEHQGFRDTVRRFAQAEIAPHFARWESAGLVDRAYWTKGGAAGLLCPQVPEAYGGADGDFRFNAVVIEELWYAGYAGPGADFSVHSDVCCGYLLSFGTEAQKRAWLPRMVSGQAVCAIAMTEPGTGSDLQGVRTRAVRDGDHYVVDGQKTFISNGQHCDLVIAVVRTGGEGSAGMSLLLIETDRPGFRRGRNLDKLGHLSADTSEMFFDQVRVPVENLLGEEGRAMAHLMSELPQERLTIALQSIAAAQKAFDLTCAYVRERKAFGKSVAEFQNTRYKLADLKADLSVGWAFVDQCLARHVAGQLSSQDASTAKLWCSEMQGRVVDQCVQLHGGYGFMREYEICRLYADARVQRIYGGTSEIMRELIARGL
ncbi:acyl-CoA dehydrogenase family protein [Castellaniella defragrans]|uniref:Acyl-[acyl-carrier-protein] dehydrogenase MbtN n=1 Tax=Castellaniella defragrans TaxID=75697 RepID=A0A7W9WQ53_CASDE|nr:acyl-CoA dehydrogenase family protein [Castellaniella defragrans]KAB0622736.1 acyl-CoA dehydrogenase [Castellaniella defragrans]MBB6085248.1 alkylation response protein AidB-like acyl-CoA dehydrogenase [Castellaniella defragrans]